ncbi:hypothetical protein BURK1_03093 [Burkholderiales bacterium]|nr:hypothetical protein BURK1_03093 [Burkholderiales bacterium]
MCPSTVTHTREWGIVRGAATGAELAALASRRETLMNVTSITYCEDLLRPTRAFAWGFLDFVEEAIFQGAALRIGNPVGRPPCDSIASGFSLDRFYGLAGGLPDQDRWIACYMTIPKAAEAYLADHLKAGTLLMSFELPPWLQAVCNDRGVPWIDLRPSPIRFARDLYIAIRTSHRGIAERLAAFDVPESEIRLEASLLAASVRMHQRRLEEAGRFTFDLDDSLVYVAQAPYDASLIRMSSGVVGLGDYLDRVRAIAGTRRVLYKPHPFAEWHAESERALLRDALGRRVELCRQNAYQILAARCNVDLVGLSSGLLQEARYFSKRAHILFQSLVPLNAHGQISNVHAFHQVRFAEFLSPAFWHRVLAPDRSVPDFSSLSPVQPNHARELLDQWWDYSKCMIWERSLWIEGFTRSGGGLLRDRVDALERVVQSLREES